MSLIWPTVHLVNALFTQCIVTGSNERGCRWFCKHGRILALFPPPPAPVWTSISSLPPLLQKKELEQYAAILNFECTNDCKMY